MKGSDVVKSIYLQKEDQTINVTMDGLVSLAAWIEHVPPSANKDKKQRQFLRDMYRDVGLVKVLAALVFFSSDDDPDTEFANAKTQEEVRSSLKKLFGID